MKLYHRPTFWFSLMASLVPLYWVLVFIHSYSLSVPFADQWDGSLPIALAVQTGDFPAETIWAPVNGHRHIFMHLLTVISAALLDWNPKAEAYVNPLLVALNLCLLVRLFYQQRAELVFWYAPLASLLLYSLYPNDLWLFSWNAAWQFAFCFFLLSFSSLYLSPPQGRAVFWALLWAIAATFSFGTGMLVWPLMLPVLWLKGYRQAWVYGLYGILAVACVWVYFSGGSSEGQFVTLGVENIGPVLLFALRMLGSPLSVAGYEPTWPAIAGGTALALMGVNLRAIWRRGEDLLRLAPSLSLAAYGLGIVAMVTLTRFDAQDENIALAGRYAYASLVFLLSLAGLILLHWGEGPRYLDIGNGLLGLIFLGALLQANMASVVFTSQQSGRLYLYHQSSPPYAEQCVRDFPLYRDPACLGEFINNGGGEPEQVYQLAAYRSTVFANIPPQQLLPQVYQVGSPLVISSPSIWWNIYARDSLFNFFPEAHLWHVAPSNTSPIPLPGPQPGRQSAPLSPEFVADLGDKATFWHFFPAESAGLDAELAVALPDYLPTPVRILAPGYERAPIRLIRYDRRPENLSVQYEFGEGLELLGFELEAYQLAPCQELRLRTWWQITQPLDFSHGSTAVLTQGGTAFGQDQEIAQVALIFLEPGRPYLDERLIEIPCQIPPGRYDLLWGVYRLDPFQDLPAYDVGGGSVGNRAYLTTITIVASNE